MKSKRFTALIITTTLALTACGNNGGTSEKADEHSSDAAITAQTNAGMNVSATEEETSQGLPSDLKDGQNTELVVVFPAGSSSPADLQEVSDAITKKAQTVIDCTIKLNPIDWGSYTDQTNLMLSSGEPMGLFFSYSGSKNYASMGQVQPITDLVDDYAPDVKKTMGEFIKACYVGQDLYGFPTFRDLAQQSGLVCRTDTLQELGVDPTTVKTWDDVEKILLEVKEKYPDMYPLCSANLQRGPLQSVTQGMFDTIQSGVGVILDDDSQTILNTYATDQYKSMAEMAYKWNQEGLFMPDSTTNTTPRQDLIKVGNVFGYIGNAHPGTKTQETMNSGVDMTVIPISVRSTSTSIVNFGQWLVPSACENTKKAVAFLDLLYSDPEIQNLFRYGIEGKDYIVKDGVANYPDGVDSSNVGWNNEFWVVGNGALDYPWVTDPKDINEQYTEYNNTAKKSSLYGFSFDTSNVTNEIAAITNVTSKYEAVIEAGSSDPDATLKEFNDELKSAGIQNVIDEVTKQAEEWKKSGNE